ncbi:MULTISPECIES: pseudouridine synthase [Muribaculum]|uniref:pseudouridine synthase n=3 Tax=Muribaculaceae TaxID=2005473 RepID=UPI00248C9276|nr:MULTISPECIES: pseudouridine synthase [Muribaculum]MCX4277655.1 RNA-binding S4 domain-containing protein [Muribaculum sp.]
MDSEEKKPKRPRIGENRIAASSDGDAQHYGKVNYDQPSDYQSSGEHTQGDYQRERNYQPRPYNNNRQQGGYGNNRYNQGGYRQGNNYNNRYNQGGYQPRQQYQSPAASEGAESTTPAEGTSMSEGYTPSTQQEGGYNNYRQQGGYNNNRQGGYNNNRQGGYNNNRQGGYNNNRQGGYNNNRQGGYNNNRQGGYNNNRQGGYNNNRQQGGYNNNRQQGGYNNRQQGGYNNNRQQGPNRQGGYNNRRQQGPNRQGFNAPRQGKSFTPRPKRIEYEMPIPDPNEQIRLNKFMANAGICSRREADEFIQQGLVKVNGEVVTELGTKISHSDVVEYDEKVVTLESKCYILLNKPKDCVTTSDDPNGRTTVMDLVKGACNERIYPVGRLDRNTTGVLLLTNDGDLASKLTHPKYVKKKIYHVWTDKDISEDDMQAIADGIELEDGPIHADAISYATENDRNQAGIEIHSGRNRIVRRIFESLGYHVTKLDRVYFAGLTKKNLPRGRWRYLTQEEVNFLKMGSFE